MCFRKLAAAAVAGAFCSGALAGPAGDEPTAVQTPASVNESAPWRAGAPHLPRSRESHRVVLKLTPILVSEAGAAVTPPPSPLREGGFEPLTIVETTPYWLIGAEDEPAAVGGTVSPAAGGSGGFSSEESAAAPRDEIVVYTPSAERLAGAFGERTPLVSEHYLVSGPLEQADSSFLVLAIGPTREDIALLEALKEDFFVVTPARR